MSETTLRRAAVVTGGGGFIGRAIAIALAADGHDIALWDLDDGALDASRAAIVGAHPGASVSTHAFDLTDDGAVDAAAAATADRHGGIDVLVNCAGGLLSHPHRRPRHGGLGPDAWHKPPGPGGLHPGLPPEHGRAGRGRHRQHRLHQRGRRPPGESRLLGVEGGIGAGDARPRPRPRGARDPGQRHHPRLDRHADDPQLRRPRRDARGDAAREPREVPDRDPPRAPRDLPRTMPPRSPSWSPTRPVT